MKFPRRRHCLLGCECRVQTLEDQNQSNQGSTFGFNVSIPLQRNPYGLSSKNPFWWVVGLAALVEWSLRIGAALAVKIQGLPPIDIDSEWNGGVAPVEFFDSGRSHSRQFNRSSTPPLRSRAMSKRLPATFRNSSSRSLCDLRRTPRDRRRQGVAPPGERNLRTATTSRYARKE